MPNPIDDDIDDVDIDTDIDPDEDENSVKSLRRAAKNSKANKALADAATRELALVKAGIDTDSPLGSMFAGAYKGDLTKEAISAAWSSLGVSPAADSVATADDADAAAAADAPVLTDDEKSSTSLRQALANGASSETPTAADPRVEAVAVANSVVANGGTQDDALAAMFNKIATAAVQGDKRVLIERVQG